MRLSDRQIILAGFGIASLLFLAIVHGAQQAPFHVQGMTWESLRGFCRVSLTVENPSSERIQARAFIQALDYTDNTIDGFSDYHQTGSAKVPMRLAGKEKRTFVTDVAFSEGRDRCDRIEIQKLPGPSAADADSAPADDPRGAGTVTGRGLTFV